MSDAAQRPAVLAIVVATDGAATLPRTLAGLEAQTYEPLTVVGVDNGSSDDSRAVLTAALGRSHVLVAERDLGFGGAVSMALDAEVARGHELLLFVHDDLELVDDAVATLVDTLLGDDELAIAGCKLVDWDDRARLQAVGMSVDVTGRADPGVEADEVDQGQHDDEGRTLYVSTAGMLVRRDRFEQLGRFDHRFHLFRDDLDLCWRAWLAGWGVTVVPTAVGAHEASASTYRRLGQTAFLGPRYFAERNTLASLLKNYGLGRLLYVLPLFLLVGVAKVMGFVATRRVGDAWQTVRAWAWNVLHLGETRRLRRRVQASRVRGDRELQPLFAQVTARLRAYAEALGELVSGGSDEIGIDDATAPVRQEEPLGLGARLRTTVRTSPVGFAATVLLVLGALVSLPLLRTTPLLGGELAAWPSGALTLLDAYVRPWTVGDLPAVVAVSPGQALLALPAVLTGGSTWAAPRLLLLALVPLAWAGALRAGRVVTPRRLPRVAGATLYALSPPMLAALRTGRIGAAIATMLAPLLVIASARALQPDVPQDRAWRAVAATALLTAATVSFAPETTGLVLLAAVVAGIGVVVGQGAGVPQRLARLLTALLGAGLLLGGWMPSLTGTEGVTQVASDPGLGRLLLLAPSMPGFPGPLAGAGLAAAAALGLAFAGARRGPAAALAAVYLAAVGAGWVAVRLGAASPVWPGSPLTIAALAAAGLLVIAFSSAEAQLAEHDFGWRQLAAVGTAVVVVLGVVTSGLSIAGRAWDGYSEEPSPLPAYLASEVNAEGVGDFRTLVVADTAAGVRWAVTDGDGPTMASWGQRLPATVAGQLQSLTTDLAVGADVSAAAALGPVGVRYVVVPENGRSDRLEAALARQLDLVGQPASTGLVYRVTTWLPRMSVLPLDAAALLEAGLPLDPTWTPGALADRDETSPPALLVLGDLADGERDGWTVTTADGRELTPRRLGDVLAWELPEGTVEVAVAGRGLRVARVGVQLLLVLLALSLSVRAPRFARKEP